MLTGRGLLNVSRGYPRPLFLAWYRRRGKRKGKWVSQMKNGSRMGFTVSFADFVWPWRYGGLFRTC